LFTGLKNVPSDLARTRATGNPTIEMTRPIIWQITITESTSPTGKYRIRIMTWKNLQRIFWFGFRSLFGIIDMEKGVRRNLEN
jgi:hypothetical protein